MGLSSFLIILLVFVGLDLLAQQGVDMSNPPYLIVYAFFPQNKSEPMELNFQKIENAKQGKVVAFIYAEKMKFSSEDALQAYLQSGAYIDKRDAVVKTKFPY